MNYLASNFLHSLHCTQATYTGPCNVSGTHGTGAADQIKTRLVQLVTLLRTSQFGIEQFVEAPADVLARDTIVTPVLCRLPAKF